MTGSLRALLDRVIDYAGTFPPARLPLDEATHRFEDHRDSNQSWMLGQFVIQTSHIPELPTHFSGAQPPKISALLPASENVSEFCRQLDRDLAGIGICGFTKQVRLVEGRLPLELAKVHAADVEKFLTSVQQRIIAAGVSPAAMFWEAAGADRTPLWLGLVSFNRTLRDPGFPVGFKQRTGGLEASAVPNSASLAGVIEACRVHGIPWKATAGLHEPLPHRDAALGTTLHGFVNVLAAAAFAHAQEVPRKQLIALLDDADPASFHFTDDEMTWHDLRISTEQIIAARKLALRSFGSCSFDEPVAGLEKLGWL